MAALLDGEPKYARQVEFDALIAQITEEGSTLDDAAKEALEILQADDQDLSYLYVYFTEEEKRDKEALMKNVQTIEKASREEETPVNCLFSFQGLKQVLMCEDKKKAISSWRLCEGRSIVKSLVRILGLVKADDDDKSDSDEDSDVDEDEDEIMFMVNTLAILSLFAEEGSKQNRLRSPERLFSLDEESMGYVLARLDKHQDESRVAIPLLSFILVLMSQTENKASFIAGGGVANIELTLKMHKKNAELKAIGERVLTTLSDDVTLSG